MLDAANKAKKLHREDFAGPPLDFQEHLRRLEAHGLLTRIDRAIDKDRELHPLVRWQFQGGLAEEQRRAFLFTNRPAFAIHFGRGRLAGSRGQA